MKSHLLPAIKLTLICIVFFVGIYSAMVWAVAQLAPNHGEGETVMMNGKVVGYKLIGQKFTADKYFNGRPSAVDYNAAGSGGSNKGPSNPEYLAMVQARIDTFLIHNPGIEKASIPSELVTASGSGQDPDISPEAAMVQIRRIASERGISENNLKTLVNIYTRGPLLNLFGPSHINVLQLNIGLDKLN